MTDFSRSFQPKLILIGAAAQFGIFSAYMIALALGFEPNQAAQALPLSEVQTDQPPSS